MAISFPPVSPAPDSDAAVEPYHDAGVM